MTHSSSSTSSSDAVVVAAPTWSAIASTWLWAIAWLVAFDVAAGIAFRMPADPTVEPNRLQAYFDYGRSVEGKLRKMVTPDDATSAPIIQAGWLASVKTLEGPKVASAPDKLLIAAYGQSFTHYTLSEAAKQDPRLEIRLAAGPGAPLSYCFKAAQIDQDAHQARVVVMGALGSSIQYLSTITPIAWGFEGPTPFTYPRYRVEGGVLRETAPPFDTAAGLRHVLADPIAFRAFRDELASDASFDAFVFDQNAIDASVIGRLIRRGAGHVHQAEFSARYHDAHGFLNRDGVVDVAQSLVVAFAKLARDHGRIPVVLLFEDRGYEGLEAALVPTLQAHDVPFVSSREVAPAGDPRNFLPDGHFTSEANARIAAELVKLIAAAVPR